MEGYYFKSAEGRMDRMEVWSSLETVNKWLEIEARLGIARAYLRPMVGSLGAYTTWYLRLSGKIQNNSCVCRPCCANGSCVWARRSLKSGSVFFLNRSRALVTSICGSRQQCFPPVSYVSLPPAIPPTRVTWLPPGLSMPPTCPLWLPPVPCGSHLPCATSI